MSTPPPRQLWLIPNEHESEAITNPRTSNHASSSSSSRAPSSFSSNRSSSSSATSETLSVPRSSPPGFAKPIRYPYTSSHRLTSTLRPSRRTAAILKQLARRWIVHLALALSIPILIWALAHELRIHAEYRELGSSGKQRVPRESELQPSANRAVNLVQLRSEYEKKRRRSLLEDLAAGSQGGQGNRRFSQKGSIDLEKVGWTEEHDRKLKQEVEEYWPAWWGNADHVSQSPFDHVPVKVEGSRRRVLFLTCGCKCPRR